DCYLVLRGIKTLAVRVDRHCENAQVVAAMLRTHPRVKDVRYPGLTDHPGHVLAASQMRAPGGMISFTVDGGREAALRVVSRTRGFPLAESLGAVESILEHP